MTPQEKTLTFKGTEKQIAEVLQPLSLLPINQIDFMRKALRSNLNNLQVDENIYLNRLKEQYVEVKRNSLPSENVYRQTRYNAMREFCLDTNLLSFKEIELMEFEVNSSF